MAEPPRSELQQAPGSHIEPSQSADGSEAKGLRLEDGSRRVATSTLDNQGLLMEVVRQHGLEERTQPDLGHLGRMKDTVRRYSRYGWPNRSASSSSSHRLR